MLFETTLSQVLAVLLGLLDPGVLEEVFERHSVLGFPDYHAAEEVFQGTGHLDQSRHLGEYQVTLPESHVLDQFLLALRVEGVLAKHQFVYDHP